MEAVMPTKNIHGHKRNDTKIRSYTRRCLSTFQAILLRMLSMSAWPKLNGRLSVRYAAKVHANAPQSLPFSCVAFRRHSTAKRDQRARRTRIVTEQCFARLEPNDDVHRNRFGSVRLELGQDGTLSSHVTFTRIRPVCSRPTLGRQACNRRYIPKTRPIWVVGEYPRDDIDFYGSAQGCHGIRD